MCNSGWSSNEATANVACKQLGYYGYIDYYYINYYSNVYYGSGSGSIWLDNLNCQGNEKSLFSCPTNQIGNYNCSHNDDVGVRCYCKFLNQFFSCFINNAYESLDFSKRHIFMYSWSY